MSISPGDGISDRSEFPILVAIETDATRYHGEAARRPALLSPGDAEQMLAHLAADLSSLFGSVRNCRLASAGALFDQTQMLRPGMPLFSALSSLLREHGGSAARPALVSLGASKGTMPVAALRPDRDITPGILQLLPVLIEGPAALVAELGRGMEDRFLQRGRVSPHTAAWLEAAFGIGISHARFMTVTDLHALLRLQLQHFGFLPLWELLDAALQGRAEELPVTTETGLAFIWRDGRVRAQFESFDHWARRGAGRDRDGARQRLAQAYADWTREWRQYTTTLAAHRVPLRAVHGDGAALEGNYYCEVAEGGYGIENPASLTEHSWEQVGAVAITACTPTGLKHYYPLAAAGLNDIHAVAGGLDLAGEGVAYPGRILYDERSRRLRAARADPGGDA